MQYKRADRVSDQIKREVSDIIQRQIKDPNIGFVTITDVDMTDDLRIAKIFYSVLGDEENKEHTGLSLKKAKKFIRTEIGRRVRIKYTPLISFEYDNSIEYGARIERLIEKIHKQNQDERKDKTNS